MWDHLCSLKFIFGGDIQCVIGDFNATLFVDERRGNVGTLVSLHNVECVIFSSFIAHLDLLDHPLFGRNFTRFYHRGGRLVESIKF